MAELEDVDVQDKTEYEGVEVELGFTKSMGPNTYEFIRGDIRYRTRLREGEDHDAAADRLYKKVEDKLVEKVDELDTALGPRGRTSLIHKNKG